MKKSLAVMLALIMVLCMIPTTAFAEAGDWDPLTDPNTVAGSLVERKTFSASTTMEAGKDGYLRLMPTLDAGNNSYNAMAYCGATATSNNTSIAEVKSIEIGKWVGGVWNNADCLQVTVNPKAAGTTTVVINFYYTFSQSPNPLTNPNAKWFYGTSYYTINVTEPTKPNPPTPENTSKPFIELTGEEAVKVHCTNDNANHDDKSYGLMHDGYTVGDVKADATNGYTCDITVNPDKYVDQYNLDIEVEHKLDPESQTGTIKLVWDKENQKWKLANPSDVPVVFKVKCDNTQPPLDTITIEVSKVWHDDSNTVTKPDAITVLLLADGKEVDRATIPDVNGAWSHSFGAKPANDNGKPINYTVKEENVPDWTPYYYTAGLWKGKLIFQIHNVPTKNTREIKVTKTVSGEGADKAKYFDFKVTLLEYHDNAEVTDQPGYYPLGGTYTFGGVTFTNGVATFKLKDGDSKEITGIPTHIYSNLPLQYKVEEIAPSGYTVKVNGSTGSSISGAFTDAKTVDITFENVKESGTNPTPSPSTNPNPTPTPTPGGGNGGGGHWHPTTTPVPVIVIPPKTGDMTIWQSILHFLGII